MGRTRIWRRQRALGDNDTPCAARAPAGKIDVGKFTLLAGAICLLTFVSPLPGTAVGHGQGVGTVPVISAMHSINPLSDTVQFYVRINSVKLNRTVFGVAFLGAWAPPRNTPQNAFSGPPGWRWQFILGRRFGSEFNGWFASTRNSPLKTANLYTFGMPVAANATVPPQLLLTATSINGQPIYRFFSMILQGFKVIHLATLYPSKAPQSKTISVPVSPAACSLVIQIFPATADHTCRSIAPSVTITLGGVATAKALAGGDARRAKPCSKPYQKWTCNSASMTYCQPTPVGRNCIFWQSMLKVAFRYSHQPTYQVYKQTCNYGGSGQHGVTLTVGPCTIAHNGASVPVPPYKPPGYMRARELITVVGSATEATVTYAQHMDVHPQSGSVDFSYESP